MSLAAYRNLLRAARVAFQGDVHVLSAAQLQIRQGFQGNRALDSTSGIQTAIQHAQDVATILRENVVQGRKQDNNADTFKLRIHKYTERGDNDSILTAGNQSGGGGCGCK